MHGRTGDKHHRYGTSHSRSIKEQISRNRKGKCVGSSNHKSKRIEYGGCVYDSVRSAAADNDVSVYYIKLRGTFL